MWRWGGVWPENRDAWAIYQALGGKVVQAIQAGPWVLERATAGRSWANCEALLRRLELIESVLHPVVPNGE